MLKEGKKEMERKVNNLKDSGEGVREAQEERRRRESRWEGLGGGTGNKEKG